MLNFTWKNGSLNVSILCSFPSKTLRKRLLLAACCKLAHSTDKRAFLSMETFALNQTVDFCPYFVMDTAILCWNVNNYLLRLPQIFFLKKAVTPIHPLIVVLDYFQSSVTLTIFDCLLTNQKQNIAVKRVNNQSFDRHVIEKKRKLLKMLY